PCASQSSRDAHDLPLLGDVLRQSPRPGLSSPVDRRRNDGGAVAPHGDRRRARSDARVARDRVRAQLPSRLRRVARRDVARDGVARPGGPVFDPGAAGGAPPRGNSPNPSPRFFPTGGSRGRGGTEGGPRPPPRPRASPPRSPPQSPGASPRRKRKPRH